MDGRDWLSILNSVGFPLVALYALVRGYVVSPRELDAVKAQYNDLRMRYDKLEAEVREERTQLRTELAETRAMLVRVMLGDKAGQAAAGD